MPFQMALDEILFRSLEHGDSGGLFPVEEPLFRIYFSSEPWITAGYSHLDSHSRTVLGGNPQTCGSPTKSFGDDKVPVCRRITGGGLVHHGRDLIFSIAARKIDDESFKSVRLAYLKIHEAVKTAFEACGIQSRFYRCDENLPRGRDCFVFPIATDLAVGNKKVAGGAQKRSSGALLHQESIQDIHGVDPFELAVKLREGFEKVFQIRLQTLDLNPRLLEEAKKLAQDKYDLRASHL